MNSDQYKNILVTGGYGFIGSHFIRRLYHKYPNYRIFNLDLLTYAGNQDNLLDIEELERHSTTKEKRYHFIYGDICDVRLLDILFQRHNFEMVFNFAAETHVDRSIISMGDFIHTNIGGVRSLTEAVRKYNVPRFIHISTDEIYGSVDTGYSNEDSPLKPSNPYSSSKAAADLILQSFIRTHNVPALIVRGSNNFGTHQYPEKLIPLSICNILENKKIPVHGEGKHIRSWIHVKDYCSAIDCVGHNSPLYEAYNISGEEKTNIEILNMIAKYLDVDLNRYKEHIADRPGADTRYAVDGSKLEKNLNWKPEYSLSVSMGEIIDWYQHNKDWWNKIRTKKEYLDHYKKQSTGQWY